MRSGVMSWLDDVYHLHGRRVPSAEEEEPEDGGEGEDAPDPAREMRVLVHETRRLVAETAGLDDW